MQMNRRAFSMRCDRMVREIDEMLGRIDEHQRKCGPNEKVWTLTAMRLAGAGISLSSAAHDLEKN